MDNTFLPYSISGQALYYTMPREVDHHVAQGLCKELDMLIDAHRIKELILDFKQTEFMDSSGIGVVIGRSKAMHFHEGVVFVMNVGKRVDTIFKSAGLYKIVSVREV